MEIEVVDDYDDTEEVDGGGSQSGGFSGLPEEQQEELVKRIIRLMIVRNMEKKPVLRQQLTAHVFKDMTNVGSKARIFKGALQRAQQKLRNGLGMDIVLVQKRFKAGGTQRATSMSASQSQGGGMGSKGYILISTLSDEAKSAEGLPVAEMGFVTVLACIIVLEPGCRIAEDALHKILEKMGVHVRERQGHKQLNGGNVKELLEKKLVEQWYLEKEKEDNQIFYTVGPRLRAEIKGDDLLEFINAVYMKGAGPDSVLDATAWKEVKLRMDEAWGVEPDEEDA